MYPTSGFAAQRINVESASIASLESAIDDHMNSLANHPLFAKINTIETVCTFMEYHVYAVWDFMCLLKSLQQKVTCCSHPWLPVGDPETRRLVNEICLDEESDELDDGQCLSHFEMYLNAMQEAGANTQVVESFLTQLKDGDTVEQALSVTDVPAPSRHFIMDTMAVIERGEAHTLAAAFTIGREVAIPRMFSTLVNSLSTKMTGLDTLKIYLKRHIELDGDKHGPLGIQMIANLCGNNGDKWHEATEAAIKALRSRIVLWDGIQNAIQ